MVTHVQMQRVREQVFMYKCKKCKKKCTTRTTLTYLLLVLVQGPDMTNPCCKVWLDGAKAISADDRPDRPPGCNLVSPCSLPILIPSA